MEGSSIMNYLTTNEELLAMRKEWKELGIDTPFPLFHFETYIDVYDYTEKVRAKLDDYKKESR